MFSFLDDVELESLRSVCKAEAGRFGSLIGAGDRAALYRTLFALLGTDVLTSRFTRRALLLTLSPGALAEVARTLEVPDSGPAFDIAGAIATKRWTYGAALVREFSRRFPIPIDFLPVESERVDGVERISAFEDPPPLFDYQEEVAQRLVHELASDEARRLMVQLPTGAGKTRTSVSALVRWMRTGPKRGGVLWLAHTEELCDQAAETFVRIWRAEGEGSALLGRCWGDLRCPLDELAGGFVVASYQRAVGLARRDPEALGVLLSKLGVVVVDEAHRALAKGIRGFVDGLTSARFGLHLVGLTATPGRSAEGKAENRDLADMFDGALLTPASLGSDPMSELVRRGILARVRRIELRTCLSLGADDVDEVMSDFSGATLRTLAGNEKRNQLILGEVDRRLRDANPCLVFGCTVDHARALALRSAAAGHAAGFVDCRMRQSMRRGVIRAFRRGEIDVLYNFGVLSTGFDVPRVKTIIIARPTTSVVLYSQMIGRGLRGPAVGGTVGCELVDVRDNFEAFGDVDAMYRHFEEFWAFV